MDPSTREPPAEADSYGAVKAEAEHAAGLSSEGKVAPVPDAGSSGTANSSGAHSSSGTTRKHPSSSDSRSSWAAPLNPLVDAAPAKPSADAGMESRREGDPDLSHVLQHIHSQHSATEDVIAGAQEGGSRQLGPASQRPPNPAQRRPPASLEPQPSVFQPMPSLTHLQLPTSPLHLPDQAEAHPPDINEAPAAPLLLPTMESSSPIASGSPKPRGPNKGAQFGLGSKGGEGSTPHGRMKERASHMKGILLDKLTVESSRASSVEPSGPSMGEMDVAGDDNYIPFRYTDLKEELMSSFESYFESDERIEQFHELVRWMSLRNNLRLAVRFRDVHNFYNAVDPDCWDGSQTTLAVVARGIPGVNGVAADVGAMHGKKESVEFQAGFGRVLDKGDYDELPIENLIQLNEENAGYMGPFGTGLRIRDIDLDQYEIRLWERGRHTCEEEFSSWRTFWRTRTYTVYNFERVVCMFRKRSYEEMLQIKIARGDKPPHPLLLLWSQIFEKLFKRRVGKEMALELTTDKLYLKMFKKVAHYDIKVLLPGAGVLFGWLDYLVIWLPIAVGVGFAIWKITTNNFNLHAIKDVLITIFVILTPFIAAFKGYLQIRTKIELLQAYINNLFLVFNISNNAGVISLVLNEAGEQEDKESLLAYFFLWKGEDNPLPRCKQELDAEVEAWLKKIMKERDLPWVDIDFAVQDSVNKLHVMGILEHPLGPDGKRLLKVLPLDQALAKSHPSKFNELKEVFQIPTVTKPSGLRRRATRVANSTNGLWLECEAVDEETTRRFRYFWHTETGETTYAAPTEYLPSSSIASVATPAPSRRQDRELAGAGSPASPSTPPGRPHLTKRLKKTPPKGPPPRSAFLD